MQEMTSLLWAFVWWQTTISQLLWVLSTSWLLLFLFFAAFSPGEISPHLPDKVPMGMASTPLRVLSWQWVENYAETSLGNAYSIPQCLLALVLGSALNCCCFKTQNEKGGIPDHCQLAWSAKASCRRLEHQLGLGEWVGFGLFTPKDVGGPLRLIGENESKFWDRNIHQVCREQWVNQSDANNCMVCFVIV